MRTPTSSTRHGRVLLTGATGFIGRHLLRRLLDAGTPVVAVVRAPDDAAAAARLGVTAPPGLLTTLAGDVTRPMFGCSRAALDGIDAIVHLAARPKLGRSEDVGAMRALHVGAVERMAELVRAARIRRVLHVSTAYVTPNAAGLLCEGPAGDPNTAANPYERTKTEAEHRALATIAAPLEIVRPGIVVPSVGARRPEIAASPLGPFFAGLAGEAAAVGALPGRPDHRPALCALDAVVAFLLTRLADLSPSGAPRFWNLVPRRESLATLGELCLGATRARLVPDLTFAAPRRAARSPWGPYLVRERGWETTRTERALAAHAVPPLVVPAADILGLLARWLEGRGVAPTAPREGADRGAAPRIEETHSCPA